MPSQHPKDDVLIEYASGTLWHEMSVLVAAHATVCPICREQIRLHEDISGALLETQKLQPETATLDLAEIEARRARSAAAGRIAPPVLDDTEGIFPRPLSRFIVEETGSTHFADLDWHVYGFGIERAILTSGPSGVRSRILRCQPEAVFPTHGHGSDEFSLVLQGALSDRNERYEAGDVQHVSREVSHAPIAEDGDICLVFVVSEEPPVLALP